MKNRLSFPIIVIAATSFIVGVTVLCSVILFSFQSADVNEYWKLMREANPSRSDSPMMPYKAEQRRQKLYKHMWLNSPSPDRLQLCLRGNTAELVLDHHEEHTEVIEQIHDVRCYMQENLFYKLPDGREATRQTDGRLMIRKGNTDDPAAYIKIDTPGLRPMQVMRYMEADHATYHYKTERLYATQVKMFRYIVPGHELVESLDQMEPILSGIAQSVELNMRDNERHITANQFKAKLHHEL